MSVIDVYRPSSDSKALQPAGWPASERQAPRGFQSDAGVTPARSGARWVIGDPARSICRADGYEQQRAAIASVQRTGAAGAAKYVAQRICIQSTNQPEEQTSQRCAPAGWAVAGQPLRWLRVEAAPLRIAGSTQ